MLILMYGIACHLSKTELDDFIAFIAIAFDAFLVITLIPLFICAFGGVCK